MDNGLEACFVPNDDPLARWTAQFQANRDVYDVPFDRPFTVSCSAWGTIDRQDCNVSYNYTKETRIAYGFRLKELPAMEMIAFDQGLRAKLNPCV